MSTRPTPARLVPVSFAGLVVRKLGSDWAVGSPSHTHARSATKALAVTQARQLLAADGGKIVIVAANGQIREQVVVGATAGRHLNAIEGLHVNAASRDLLAILSAGHPTSAQRRALVLSGLKKVPES